jgi:hypothetical protein
MYALQANLLCDTIGPVHDVPKKYSMNAPLHLQTHKMPQTKRSSRMSDNLHRRKRVRADQPVNDPVLLPERDTNPEWGNKHTYTDVLPKRLTRLHWYVAETIITMYPYEGHKMQIESIRALLSIFDRQGAVLMAETSSVGFCLETQLQGDIMHDHASDGAATEDPVAAWVQARPPCRGDLIRR